MGKFWGKLFAFAHDVEQTRTGTRFEPTGRLRHWANTSGSNTLFPCPGMSSAILRPSLLRHAGHLHAWAPLIPQRTSDAGTVITPL